MLNLDDEFARVARECAADVRFLMRESFDVNVISHFLASLPETLAAAKPGHADVARRPDYLVNATFRLQKVAGAWVIVERR